MDFKVFIKGDKQWHLLNSIKNYLKKYISANI